MIDLDLHPPRTTMRQARAADPLDGIDLTRRTFIENAHTIADLTADAARYRRVLSGDVIPLLVDATDAAIAGDTRVTVEFLDRALSRIGRILSEDSVRRG